MTTYGQTIVMVTHDANAASYADRVVFLADGQVVDEMREPTADRVLDRLKSLERLDDRVARDHQEPAREEAPTRADRRLRRARRRDSWRAPTSSPTR